MQTKIKTVAWTRSVNDVSMMDGSSSSCSIQMDLGAACAVCKSDLLPGPSTDYSQSVQLIRLLPVSSYILIENDMLVSVEKTRVPVVGAVYIQQRTHLNTNDYGCSHTRADYASLHSGLILGSLGRVSIRIGSIHHFCAAQNYA